MYIPNHQKLQPCARLWTGGSADRELINACKITLAFIGEHIPEKKDLEMRSPIFFLNVGF
jgi:hypothetical protein